MKTEEICFGLNRETDERSLAAFLHPSPGTRRNSGNSWFSFPADA